jgi:ribosomal protein L30E
MDANEIKKMLKNENLVLGSDRVLKLLRENQMESIWLAANAPGVVVDDIKRYAQLSGTGVETLLIPNDELGVVCKKPFNIAVIGLKKSIQQPKKRH